MVTPSRRRRRRPPSRFIYYDAALLTIYNINETPMHYREIIYNHAIFIEARRIIRRHAFPSPIWIDNKLIITTPLRCR